MQYKIGLHINMDKSLKVILIVIGIVVAVLIAKNFMFTIIEGVQVKCSYGGGTTYSCTSTGVEMINTKPGEEFSVGIVNNVELTIYNFCIANSVMASNSRVGEFVTKNSEINNRVSTTVYLIAKDMPPYVSDASIDIGDKDGDGDSDSDDWFKYKWGDLVPMAERPSHCYKNMNYYCYGFYPKELAKLHYNKQLIIISGSLISGVDSKYNRNYKTYGFCSLESGGCSVKDPTVAGEETKDYKIDLRYSQITVYMKYDGFSTEDICKIDSSLSICSTTPALKGDTNNDGKIDRNELGIMISQWVNNTITRDELGIAIQKWVTG